jgi:hypothetical protein
MHNLKSLAKLFSLGTTARDHQQETTGFSRVESQFQPSAVTVLNSQRPSTLVAWSLNFSLSTISHNLIRDHRLQPRGVSISTFACSLLI